MILNKSQSIAIITIYRNNKEDTRRLQKIKFLEKIKFLKKYGNFDIFLIEQSEDGNKFNPGKLRNIGYDLAKKSNNKYDFFIFSDIDIIPDKNLAKYYFKLINGVGCFGIRGTRYKFLSQGKCFTGTSIGANKESFEKINGYPNNFWGWGGEDDLIHGRSNINNIQMYSPVKGYVIDLERDENNKKISSKQKNIYLKNNNLREKSRFEKVILDRKIWHNNGINNLNYDILKEDIVLSSIYNLHHYIVDLKYKSDKSKFPHWYDISKYESLEYEDLKKLYKNVKEKYYKCNIIDY